MTTQLIDRSLFGYDVDRWSVRDANKKQKYSLKDISVHDLNELDKYIDDSNPSDFIRYDRSTWSVLDNYTTKVLGIKTDKFNQTIPNDIFKLDTVPLPDVVFNSVLDDKDDFWCRMIFTNGKLILICASVPYNFTIALTVEPSSETECRINKNHLYVKFTNLFQYDNVKQSKEDIMISAINLVSHYMTHWYALQIMLLNPVIKEQLFVATKKEKLRISESYITGSETNTKKKRKTKYVKYKTISQVLLHSDILRKKHAMCWYVIGHYRHYRDGRKTWVHGYWKGPMRELKKNLDEGRERLL